jgi:hypothetical protein
LLAAVNLLRGTFDLFQWTIYPAQEVLFELIQIEESQMVERERAVAAGLADPGQPSYETSYGRLAGSVDYCAIFSDLEPGCGLPLHRNGMLYDTGLTNFSYGTFPSLPVISALVHLNITVKSRTECCGRRLHLEQD